MKNEKNDKQHETVTKLVHFQNTGRGFDCFWADVEGIVADFARSALLSTLLKGGVKSAFADVDEGLGDVVNNTFLRLHGLGSPGAGGRFDPSRASQPGLSGLRGWLWTVVNSQAVNWVRDCRGGRGPKITCESGIDWNPLADDDGPSSLLDRQVAKLVRADLRPILEECIATLPDPLMRELASLKLDEELSVRSSARRLDLTDSKVQRSLTNAYALLRPLLEGRGIDASWLAA